MVTLNATTAALGKLVFDLKLPSHCECCYEHRHVNRDSYGGVAMLCARCDFQVRATGQCHLHRSRVFYPELARPEAVPTPPDVEALFHTKAEPKYDVNELADADA
jgi:hypothetical protein